MDTGPVAGSKRDLQALSARLKGSGRVLADLELKARQSLGQRMISTMHSIAGGDKQLQRVAESARMTGTTRPAVRIGGTAKPWLVAANFGVSHNKTRKVNGKRGERTMVGWNGLPQRKGDGDNLLYRSLKAEAPKLREDYDQLLGKILNN